MEIFGTKYEEMIFDIGTEYINDNRSFRYYKHDHIQNGYRGYNIPPNKEIAFYIPASDPKINTKYVNFIRDELVSFELIRPN